MEANTRDLKESWQVDNGPVHGQDQYRVCHVIAAWFRTGQDKEQVLGSTNTCRGKAGPGPSVIQSRSSRTDQGHARARPEQGHSAEFVQVEMQKKNIQKQRPEAGTTLRKDLVGPA